MSDVDLKHLEDRLLEERQEAVHDIRQAESEESEGQRESAGELSRMPLHQADAGSDTQEAEKDFANVARESEKLAYIDEALRLLRADPDRYRRCESCGAAIAAERFELVPWARKCAACARAEEDGTGGG